MWRLLREFHSPKPEWKSLTLCSSSEELESVIRKLQLVMLTQSLPSPCAWVGAFDLECVLSPFNLLFFFFLNEKSTAVFQKNRPNGTFVVFVVLSVSQEVYLSLLAISDLLTAQNSWICYLLSSQSSVHVTSCVVL